MKTVFLSLLVIGSSIAFAGNYPEVSTIPNQGFALVSEGQPTAIWIDPTAPQGLKTVAGWFAEDLEKLSGSVPLISQEDKPITTRCVLVGILGSGGLIDQLAAEGKIDTSEVTGKLEASVTQLIDSPSMGFQSMLVIAGSDKRGAIYGLLDLSRASGVSPWHWWADTPVHRQMNLYVSPDRHVRQPPKVRYRGIFLNDEAPALANWAQEKFDGCNSHFYSHVFELILRLRGNFLWPAMWGRSLFDDDLESQRLADELGIVLSTSHHEPLQRAHIEWDRYGNGPWDYDRNAEKLQVFWREGVRRMGDRESVVTLGMRGDGDEPMTKDANINLLERIVRDQRQILAEELGRDPKTQPQVWALYKEVQEYYDRGMRAPDDVILLLCDDNWGNIRRLPRPDDPRHPGGYGIYYHFDYVGDPRNYKWVNTSPLPRVWEQMNLCWRHGVDQIWIVNVGDLKPMEHPIDFFLTMAYDPDAFPAEDIGTRIAQWQRDWAQEQFGSEYAKEIASLITGYAKLNGRCKPELLEADTYSLTNHREWERVVAEWQELAKRAEQIEAKLSKEYASAYYQLVLHPILACENLNKLYYTVAKNKACAAQGHAATNSLADQAERLFAKDGELTKRYHRLKGGKWNHMMSQTHIGYTYWQQPEEQTMPESQRIDIPQRAQLGISIEGPSETELPMMLPGGRQSWIEVFNRGNEPLQFSVKASKAWVTLSTEKGIADPQSGLEVKIDWSQLPTSTAGLQEATVFIRGSDGQEAEVGVTAYLPPPNAEGFVEANGYVAIEACNFQCAIDNGKFTWQIIPDLGRTGSSVITTPVTVGPTEVSKGNAYLEYPLHLISDGPVTVDAYVSPTLDFYGADTSGEDLGIRFAVSIDDGKPVGVDLHADHSTPEHNYMPWRARVAANIHIATSPPLATTAGNHTLKFWRIDSGIVLQKLVIKTGEMAPSFLGPPESPQANRPE